MKWYLAIEPYRVQEVAIEKGYLQEGFAYFMDMGTGKTLVTLSEFHQLYTDGVVNLLLVICPNSIKETTWAKHIREHLPQADLHVWPAIRPEIKGMTIVVMNYEAVITMGGRKYIQELLSIRKVMFVLDESINIKNYKALRTKALLQFTERAKVRRILTGNPIVQGPHDVWAQFRFIGELQRWNYFAFRNHFCRMGGWQGKQVIGAQNIEELNAILQRSSFRARKDEWLDLPKKIFTSRKYSLTPEQKKHYESIRKDLITQISQTEYVEVQMMISAMIKMQQICSGFIIDNAGKTHDLPNATSKIDLLDEVLEEVRGKVLIFCYFRHSQTKIINHLGVDVTAWIKGDMTPAALKEQTDRFAQDPKVRYMVVQVRSGKYGHTLTGGAGDNRCATTIFYEHSYSLDDRSQAEDRNHRIGQDKPVVYVDFVGPKIEEDIVRALVKKLDIATAIVDGLRRTNGDLQ